MRAPIGKMVLLTLCLWILHGPSPVAAQEKVRLAASPTLSPDGKKLAFSWRRDIWIVGSGGGAARPLTLHDATETRPAFSPDGKWIAFNSDRNGASHAYLVPASGGTPKQLTFHSEGCRVEQWYPDGKSLLVNANRDHYWRHEERFFQINTEERSSEQLLFDGYGRSGSLSADGKRLLFTREGTAWWRKGYHGAQASQIWLYDLASKKFRKLVDEPTGARYPLWAPDGKGFYYVGGQSGAFNLWYRPLAGGEEKQLTQFEDDSIVMPCISADGKTIVFRHLFDLYRFDTESAEPPKRLNISIRADMVADKFQRRRLNKAEEVAFSKDGLEIAMISGGDLWVMDTELREPRQVTSTPEEERNPVFTPDGKAILFASDAEGQSDLWKAERTEGTRYWWQNDEFKLTRLTKDVEVEEDLQISPTGKDVAFVRGRGDLWLIGADGKNERRLFESWRPADFDWSPDGKWLVYSQLDDEFNRDIWIWPIDGSREPFNVSRHPDNDYGPVWSPDGKTIAFTGRRVGTEIDIYYVSLTKADNETTSRDRKLQSAIEKIEKVRGKQPAAKPAEKPEDEKKDEAGDDAKEEKKEEPKPPTTSGDKTLPLVRIDFDGLCNRIRRVSISDTSEGYLLWSPDSKKLAFRAKINGREGTYTISPPSDLSPKLLSSKMGYDARWLAHGNQIVWRVDGVPARLGADGKTATYSFSAYQEFDVGARYRAAFDLCWRTMRDNFYDGALNHRNWDAIRRKYSEVAAEAIDGNGLDEVVNLMLGELNGSHLGFTPRSSGSYSSKQAWTDATPHFGLRFAVDFAGPGMKVHDVIPGSPADHVKTRILADEIVMAIDEQPIDPAMDLTQLLNGRLDRDVTLTVRNAKGEDRDVTIRPISYASARSLLYEAWIKQNRVAVAKASDGKLGYLHIRAMNMDSFYRFERELYDAGAGKDGLVIDVRENGGGNTADYLLTALTQPVHGITVPRGGTAGYPQDRCVYATWRKPIAVLCNQNSFSNAEIFSHAIKSLGRGRLIGTPTAGAVISTGATSIMDVGMLRLPYRGWFVAKTGQDMELNGAVPHAIVWPQPCEMPQGIDHQLEKAVTILKTEVEKWNKRPQPKLQTASDLRKGEGQ